MFLLGNFGHGLGQGHTQVNEDNTEKNLTCFRTMAF